MNKTVRITTLLTTLAIAGTAFGQAIPRDVRQQAAALRDAAMEDTIAYELVESLTREVGPRPAGSAADAAAVRWAIAKLEALGFENVHADPFPVPHWDRGTLDVTLTSPYLQPLVATSLGGSAGTPHEGLEAPIVRVESLTALRALTTDDLEGRIAYVDHVMERHRTGMGYRASSQIRACAHVAAAERGAIAAVIRSAGTSTHRFAHTGSMRMNNVPGTIPAVALANTDADQLTAIVNTGQPVTVRIHSTARDLPPAMSANVVGEVPGQGELADEIVLLMAHLDSWDLGTGAIDDASGVAIVTTAAKMILDSGDAPRRTIRVVLTGNEEFGLTGADYYYAAHADDLDKHVIGLEADFGAGRVWQFSSRVAHESLDLVDGIHRLLRRIDIERGNNLAFGGADLSPLRKAGMPVLGMSQDGTLYFDYHHTADDTIDKIDRGDLNQNVAAYVTAAYVAANIERDFGRLEVDTSVRSCDPQPATANQ